MRRFWLALALALSPFLVAAPVGATALIGGEQLPVGAAMTTVGPHRMAVIAVRHDIFGLVIDEQMYARSFRDDVRELDVTMLPAEGPPTDNFRLDFGSGTAHWSIAMTIPRSGTGLFTATAGGTRER